jgi:crotonobetainyl-CoA:carnitine CoA-transferase CaiB-like acyl-CoA transferase
MPLDVALASLERCGIPAVAARQPMLLPDDPDLVDLDMFTTLEMADGTPFYTTNRYARFSRTQEQRVFTSPGVGEHSRQILAESGVAESIIDSLVAAGSIKQGEPFRVMAIQNYR